VTEGPLRRLTRAVREGEVTATSLAHASLERLDAFDPLLRVTALRDDDGALERAARIDRGEVGPGALLGATTLVKDLEDWRGHPTVKGSLALAHGAPAPQDGVVPGRLFAAGAVGVGKATLPEFAIEGYTANRVSGVTRNPWDPRFSPGGSSGGSAAALAAGLVLVATATDGGGSIRIPASLCGLVGLKPTNGMIGRWPAPDWMDYSTDGPFATAADDLALLYDVMVGPVAGDPTSPPRRVYDHFARWDERPVRLIAAERTSPFGPLPPGVAACLREAVDAMADLLGAPVQWRDAATFFPDGDPDLDWFIVAGAEHVAALGRTWVEEHFDEFHVSTREFLGAGLRVDIDDYLAARRRRFAYVRTLDELLGEDGLLLTPTVASEGWLADGRVDENATAPGMPPDVYSTVVQNTTGHPALTLPVGHLPTGLPFGLQVTAAHYHDRRLLDLAALFEAAHPWARCAPGYEPLTSAVGL
jgi:Asp-tRNA(Asn)/Glu-tRNA(Gln) amidotransferase A subunit family amidase